ncbi:MAG: hypothetical protein JNM22_17950 [Saprospiraceae bacterium]|nr:hypothetical protein [Saprospiraceae bacterium]
MLVKTRIRDVVFIIRTARVMALVNAAMEDAGVVCWDIKYFYLLPRPSEVDPSIETCTGIPNFPAYTSGKKVGQYAVQRALTDGAE